MEREEDTSILEPQRVFRKEKEISFFSFFASINKGIGFNKIPE